MKLNWKCFFLGHTFNGPWTRWADPIGKFVYKKKCLRCEYILTAIEVNLGVNPEASDDRNDNNL
jgi:hypothetical protein